MSAQEELRELVDQLGDEQASDALAYVRGLLGARSASSGSNGKSHRHVLPPTISGELFFAPAQGQPTPVAHQKEAPVAGFDELLGDFWPEDETADEFIAAMRQWRREGGPAGGNA